jgi:hypothetical protein
MAFGEILNSSFKPFPIKNQSPPKLNVGGGMFGQISQTLLDMSKNTLST